MPPSTIPLDTVTLPQQTCLLSLVIPTLNEGQTIQLLLQRLVPELDRLIPQAYELWIVDDCSEDDTEARVRQLQRHYPQLHWLQRQQERGLASATIAGWQQAQGEILGVMDGDLQHPPELLPQLLQEIERGADVAIASRYGRDGSVGGQWGWWRQWASRIAMTLSRWVVPEVVQNISDPMSGFFLVRRQAIGDRPLQPIGYKVLLEVLAKGRIQDVREVGYRFDARYGGRSKVTWYHSWVYIWHLTRLRLGR
ncbi:MAG: polyprenol monophosphomannose synthase [Synechococcus sp.]